MIYSNVSYAKIIFAEQPSKTLLGSDLQVHLPRVADPDLRQVGLQLQSTNQVYQGIMLALLILSTWVQMTLTTYSIQYYN